MAESSNLSDGGDTRVVPGSGGRRRLAASLAAIGAAFLASLCCIGPVLFVTLGVGAGWASRFEPLRPVFSVLTVGFIAVGFYAVYGRRPAAATAGSGEVTGACDVPRGRTRDKILLWIAAVVALVLLTFPRWSKWLV